MPRANCVVIKLDESLIAGAGQGVGVAYEI